MAENARKFVENRFIENGDDSKMYKKHYGEKVMINSKYTKENGAGIWEPVVAGGELRTDTDAALYNGGWNKRRIADGISYYSRRDVTIFNVDVP